jgi:hypothetical protein
MEAIKARVTALEDHLGKDAEIKNLVGSLRHPFTNTWFELNKLTPHVFDGFLRGQVVAGRVIAFIEGKQIGRELPEIKTSPEGSGVDRTGPTALVEPLIPQPEAPVEPQPEAPVEPQPEAPVEQPVEPVAEQPAEQPAAPAAVKSSILKKPAA